MEQNYYFDIIVELITLNKLSCSYVEKFIDSRFLEIKIFI